MEDVAICKARCNEKRAQSIARGTSREEAQGIYDDCIEECEVGKRHRTPGSPCAGAGYRPPLVGGSQLAPCREGYVPKKAEDGTPWCCSTASPGPEPTPPEPEPTPGEGCEGGYVLSGSAISAGGGELWTDGIIKPEHGWHRDPTAAGHWIWHKEHGYQRLADVHASIQGTKTLTKFEGGACRKGFQPKIMGGVTWCCPEGAPGPEPTPPGEEFTWSPEMREAIQRMMERFEEMLDRPYGLSEEERQAIINYYTSGIKGGERGRLQSMEDRLARMGMAGGGLELAETGRIQRGTREQVAGVTQGLAIDEIDKVLMNYLQTTGMAQGLLGTLMGTEQVPEMLSAQRRGEGLSQQQMILQYLSTIFGGQSNAYWQSIMNYMGGGGQQEGDIWDWLPYLAYGAMPGSRTRRY